MRPLAGLVVDRRHASVLGFEHVDLGGEAKRFGGEQKPARFQGLVRAKILRRGQSGGGAVFGCAMRAAAGGGVGVAGPFAVAPFKDGEAGAVDPFVQHAGGDERLVRRGGRGEEGKLGLIGHGAALADEAGALS